MGRRTRLDIIYDILRVIREKNGKIKPTHLMYKANMSHTSLNSYLNELEEKEMVGEIEEKGKKFLTLEDKGAEFLQEFDKMKEFQETFGI